MKPAPLLLGLLLGLNLAFPALAAPPLRLISSPPLALEAELEASAEDPGALLLRLRLPERRGLALVDLRLSPGLSLLSDSSRPYVDEGGRTGSEILLELLAKGGEGRVESLVLGDELGKVEIAPFELPLGPAAEAGAAPAWRWVAPTRVYRYQSFPLSLEGPPGQGLDPAAWPSFELPPGLYLEGRGSFSWLATALEAGKLLLPPASVEKSGGAAAPPRELEVLELPPALAASRAVGVFSLSLQCPARAEAGSPLTIRVVVKGEGNLPSLILPALRVELRGGGGEELLVPRSERRIDDIAASATDYRGSAALELSYLPPRPGSLLVLVEPWPSMDGEGRIRSQAPAPVSVPVLPGEAGAEAAGSKAEALLAEAAPSSSVAARALTSLREGRPGEALAALYHDARFEPRLRGLALALGRELGAYEPDWGPPLPPLLPLALGALGLSALILSALPLGRRLGRARLSGLVLAALLGLGGLGFGLFLIADRARPRELAWSTELLSRPATDSERRLRLEPGRTGSLIGETDSWLCLRFPDGSAGWLPRSSVYSY